MKELLDMYDKKSVKDILKEHSLNISKTYFTRYAVLKLIANITEKELKELKDYASEKKRY